MVSIGEAALLVGVCPATLRRWEREGLLIPDMKTKGGHRYKVENLKKSFGFVSFEEKRKPVAYARVSSSDQKADLERQVQFLKSELKKTSDHYEVISDLGSGFIFKKRGLRRLLHMIVTKQVSCLYLTHKDRLLRFGSELIFSLCKHFDTEVKILMEEQALDDQVQFSQDVIELMVVFSARLGNSK
ncbi:MAG: IS607 family transposase [Oligoflexales bacterium]|nr:IS607 family transposase [Oligoflexales bacterium]